MHQGEWEDLRIYSHGTQFWALWISELASKVVRASCCDLDRRGGSHCWCFVPINGQHGKILFGQETNIMPFSIIQTRTYKKDGKLLIDHQNNTATFSQLTLSCKNLHLPYTLNTCDLNYYGKNHRINIFLVKKYISKKYHEILNHIIPKFFGVVTPHDILQPKLVLKRSNYLIFWDQLTLINNYRFSLCYRFLLFFSSLVSNTLVMPNYFYLVHKCFSHINKLLIIYWIL